MLLALREPCTDVEALDLTADRLRRLQDAFTKAADDSRVRADRHTKRDNNADGAHPVRQDDQPTDHPQQRDPRHGPQVGPGR
ncbi:hypothetical protein GCM10010360_22340 [Streptomyces nogalater]